MEGNVCEQHFRVGDRVRFWPAGRTAGFLETLDVGATVDGIERNRYGRVSYHIRFDVPVDREMRDFRNGRARVNVYHAFTAMVESLWTDGDQEPGGGR